jgi:predicted nucleotidyltransferase
MVTMKQIEEFSEKLVREFRPHKVVLFGSYARGIVTPDSDVDLLVILPFEGKSVSKSVEMRLMLRPRFPLDLIVRTPETVRERLEMEDSFMEEVMAEGKVLYEAHNR